VGSETNMLHVKAARPPPPALQGNGSMGPRGTKRREKNRDAARKSRRKQTERADELHESLEHSNSALHKEIAALKKELHLLTMSLERHEPYCRLPSSLAGSSSNYANSVIYSRMCFLTPGKADDCSGHRVPGSALRAEKP
uniref:Si:dkey-23i12.7 n=1 Tax=Pundamilia nyererei TaxID=303518 RepID=A0A3B4GMZ1_9CICH